jgi:rhodanese-related sulfurtransferase
MLTSSAPETSRVSQATGLPPIVRSKGGTPEVSAEAVAHALSSGGQRSELAVIDVREWEELSDELGHIEGARSVPLRELAQASETWDPRTPIVLVCRSGRRSARGAQMLEALGFRNVASLTGGMLHWRDLALPVRHDLADVSRFEPEALRPPAAGATDDVRAALHVDDVRWVRLGALLQTASESCVDGRDPHAVIGTAGGDAGELLLSLGAVEAASGKSLDDAEVSRLVEAWVSTFGRFYIHTDVDALEELGAALQRDERFSGALPQRASVAEIEAFVRHPPRELEAPLVGALLEPQHVGCGHLRSLLLAPEAYGLRPELSRAVLSQVFQLLWRTPEQIDWVVLSGEHSERAVVVVRLEGALHPYTRVPALTPASAAGQAFVAHPDVAAYLREQNAHFLLEELPGLARTVGAPRLIEVMHSMAGRQLDATLQRLAQGLPRHELRFAVGGREGRLL